MSFLGKEGRAERMRRNIAVGAVIAAIFVGLAVLLGVPEMINLKF